MCCSLGGRIVRLAALPDCITLFELSRKRLLCRLALDMIRSFLYRDFAPVVGRIALASPAVHHIVYCAADSRAYEYSLAQNSVLHSVLNGIAL